MPRFLMNAAALSVAEAYAPDTQPIPSLRRRVPLRRLSPDSSACELPAGDARALQFSLQIRSIRCMPELTVRQAREVLTVWAAERRAVAGKRDEVVRAAVEAGVSKAEVHRLTGIARTTIERIVGPVSAEGGAR